MERSTSSDRLEDLLAQRVWVRRVARALVLDESRAEDLEQEAWLGALRAGEARHPRAWLGTVLRRAASNMRRAEGRRAAHEAGAPPPRPLPSPEEMVERAEVVERVARAVRGLEEPYRTTVLLRYFEDFPPADIARRLGVPAATVRTRLRRALAILRERLDGEEGGRRRRWAVLLLPLADRSVPWSPGAAAGGSALAAAAEVLLMSLKTKAAVAAGLLLAAGTAAWFLAGQTAPGPGTGGRDGTPAPAEVAAAPGPKEDPPEPAGPPVGDAVDPALGGRTRVEVQVEDAGGRPVADAAVSLHRTPPAPRDETAGRLHPPALPPVLARALTDGAGACALRDVPGGAWVLAIKADGFVRRFEELRFAEGQALAPLRVVLLRGAALSGTVYAADGTPLPGVAVEAIRPWPGGDRGFNRVAARADGEGRYRLEGLVPGTQGLLVTLPDGQVRGGGSVTVPAVEEWDIHLGGGVLLRGRVLDDATGKGVAGAVVTLATKGPQPLGSWDGLRDATAECRTGDDGSFAFPDLPPGNLERLQVHADGYLDHPDPWFDATLVDTTLSRGGIVEREVRLRRGAALRGVVTDGGGRPVPGARVTFHGFVPEKGNWSPIRIAPAPTVVTGPDGAYRIPAARPGMGLLEATAPGLAAPGFNPEAWGSSAAGPRPGNESLVEVPLSGEVVRHLQLVVAAVVKGTVVDADGGPLAGIAVTVVPAVRVSHKDEVALFGAGPTGITDARGGFLLADVPPGRTIRVEAVGPGGRRGLSDPVETAAGATVEGVKVTAPGGASLEGRIRRSDGKPLVDPDLRLVEGMRPWLPWWGDQNKVNRQWARPVPVGADNRFRVDGLEPGNYQLEGRAVGCATVLGPDIAVEAGDRKEGIEVLLEPGLSLAGVVSDEAGNPVAGAEVMVVPGDFQPYLFSYGLAPAATVVTDGQGRFRQDGLEPGKVNLTVRAPGYAVLKEGAEAGASDLKITLRPALTIAGTVVESGSGRPVTGLEVGADPDPRPSGGWYRGRATTGPDGSFSIEDLAPGEYLLVLGRTWSDLGENCLNKEVPGVEAGTRDLRVEVERGLLLEGRLEDEDGRPVTWGVEVAAWTVVEEGVEVTPYVYNAAVGPGGTFRANTRPGTFDLHVEPQRSRTGAAPFIPVVVPGVVGGSRDVVVRLRQGAAISGMVVYPKDPSIQQWTQGEIRIRPEGSKDVVPGAGAGQMGFDGNRKDGRMGVTFTTRMLEPGKAYDLEAVGFGPTLPGRVRGVVAGSSGVVIELSMGESIAGVVVDEAGNPSAGAPVRARGVKGSDVEDSGSSTRTGADGSFTLRRLLPGSYRLSAGGPDSDFQRTESPGDVATGATGVRLTARQGFEVTGRLLTSDGKPALGVWFGVEVEGEPYMGGQTSKEDGTFRLRGLPPGPVVLFWDAGRGRTDLGTCTAPADGLVLKLPEGALRRE